MASSSPASTDRSGMSLCQRTASRSAPSGRETASTSRSGTATRRGRHGRSAWSTRTAQVAGSSPTASPSASARIAQPAQQHQLVAGQRTDGVCGRHRWGSAIFVADLAGGTTRITDPSLNAIDPAWAPNGSTIVYVSGSTTTLHAVAPDGSNERELASLKNIVLWPDWSPDGGLVAVSAEVDKQLDVFTITADGTRRDQRLARPSDEYSPSWSPDGKRLAWARAPADQSARAYILISDRAGTRVVELRTPADLAPPVWSPDGTRLYSYVMDDTGGFYQPPRPGSRRRGACRPDPGRRERGERELATTPMTGD